MIDDIYKFIYELKCRKIYFTLSTHRDDSIMVIVCVPGERWEVEFFNGGGVEIEKFKSDGEIYDSSEIKNLFEQFGDR